MTKNMRIGAQRTAVDCGALTLEQLIEYQCGTADHPVRIEVQTQVVHPESLLREQFHGETEESELQHYKPRML